MRHKRSLLFSVALTLVAVIVPFVQAQSTSEVGDLPERREIHQSYRLEPGTNVEVSMIAGPVEIETTNNDTAVVNVIESAQTRIDLECYKTVVEHTSMRLVIRHEQSCSNVKDRQRVKLILPRYVNLSLKSIAGFVRVGAIDGMLRLDSIAGGVTVVQVQSAKISSLAKGLTIGLAQPADQGIQISSISGGVNLKVSHGLNANLVVTGLIGEIQNEASNALVTKMSESGFQAVIGSGGKSISVSSITGGIKVSQASLN